MASPRIRMVNNHRGAPDHVRSVLYKKDTEYELTGDDGDMPNWLMQAFLTSGVAVLAGDGRAKGTEGKAAQPPDAAPARSEKK